MSSPRLIVSIDELKRSPIRIGEYRIKFKNPDKVVILKRGQFLKSLRLEREDVQIEIRYDYRKVFVYIR